MTKLNESLLKYFGFSEFRAGQRQVMEQILAGKSSAAVFPTGSGKSLCYQLPALMLPALTLVVSPLIALMKDQIDALLRRNIRAARLDSSLTLPEYQEVMRAVRSGEIKILYVAPERFMNERFRAAMQGIEISLFAVDEAHCISEWGHNFRPDYLKLPRFAKALGAQSVLALTATATPDVLKDICKAFEISDDCAVCTGFYRPNLTLLTKPVTAEGRDGELLADLNKGPLGPTVVYVTLQKTAEVVAGMLRDAGLAARFYHAGMNPEHRAETQNWFLASDTGIVVATIAFGMGIDKSNIRYVYHYNLPKSMENYSQEIGRAGRDGLSSICKMYVCKDDLLVLEEFVTGDTPKEDSLGGFLKTVFGAGDRVALSLISTGKGLGIRPLVLATLMTYLELQGYVEAETPYYSDFQFRLLTSWAAIVDPLSQERQDFLNGLLKYSKKAKIWSTLDVDAAMDGLGEPRQRIVAALNWMQEQGFLELKAAGLKHPYRILKRPDSELASRMFKMVKAREQAEVGRLRSVVTWASMHECQTRALGRYFGEEISGDCGHCTACFARGL